MVRNKGEHTVRKPIWCSAETREQLQRYIARERCQLDTQGRMKLEQLGDDYRTDVTTRSGYEYAHVAPDCRYRKGATMRLQKMQS